MTQIDNQIEDYLKALKLKQIMQTYNELANKAIKSNLSYKEYLVLLLETEFNSKIDRSVKAKIAKSKFPFIKTLEEFDFSFQPSLNDKEIINLSSLNFVDQKENILFLGPPGVGKTHLSVALGVKACFARYRVLFITAQKILEELSISKRDGSLLDKLLFFSRLHILIIDEVGYMPVTNEQANLLFQLISMRYEKGSIILTSNYNFDEWGKIFDDNVIASAIIDRLVHHSKIFLINGNSYRLKNKLKQK